jgi:hypothetical protein
MGFNPFRRWASEADNGKGDRASRIGATEVKVYYPKPDAQLDAHWAELRTTGSGRKELSPDAQALLDMLPAKLLEHTARDFPHLIERFTANWSSPQAMRQVFDSLTFETRTGRQGFPLAVLTELTELRERYENAQPR